MSVPTTMLNFSLDNLRLGKGKLHPISRNNWKCFETNKAAALLIVATFLTFFPVDLPEVIMALGGAVVYALLMVMPKVQASKGGKCQTPRPSFKKVPSGDVRVTHSPKVQFTAASQSIQPVAPPRSRSTNTPVRTQSTQKQQPTVVVQPARKPTAVPITSPVFVDADFNSQVDELVSQMTPTPACKKAVEDLVRIVKDAIVELVPQVEVCGFACSSLGTRNAYGVAVPEVDIVASAPPADLSVRMHGRHLQAMGNPSKLDVRKLQKSAIRACTSLLVAAGLKFRRSSFRSTEPKVTIMAPSSLGVYPDAVPLDFSVNNTTPLYNMALFTECGMIEPRAKELILLVKRWAKDRGICHAPKGHLPPYAWSLLVIYFMQVGVEDEGPLLPPLEDFAMSSGLIGKPSGSIPTRKNENPPVQKAPKNSVGDLFKKFVKFYFKDMQWNREAVSVRLGKRAPPKLDLEIHIVVNEDGSTAVSPTIEDPFDTKSNLGKCTNGMSLKRFHEELARADGLLAKDTPLSELLELWRPPDACNLGDGEQLEEF